MMNDASNSLARMYFNTIKDFWRQATVDFVLGLNFYFIFLEDLELTFFLLLGYHKTEIFKHVPQSSKMSAEPGIERRWAKIRSDASKVTPSFYFFNFVYVA